MTSETLESCYIRSESGVESTTVTIQSAQKSSHFTAEFKSIQALRGIAALMVVIYHATQVWAGHIGSPRGYWANGAAGVDIFFVISGFVMSISTQSKRSGRHPARAFLERRMVRVVPMYWLMTAVTVLELSFLRLRPGIQNAGPHFNLTPGYIVSSLFFLPYRNSLGNVHPILIVGWTLTYEMFFYLLFACSLALRVSELRFLAPVILALAALGTFQTSAWPAVTVLVSPMLLEFLAGVAIAKAVEVGWKMPALLSACTCILSMAVLLAGPVGSALPLDWFLRGSWATLLVLSAVMLERKMASSLPGFLLLLGDASYSLYLSHDFLFAFLTQFALKLGLFVHEKTQLSWELISILAFAVLAILFALVLYRWIEAPVNNALRDKLKLRNARKQMVPA